MSTTERTNGSEQTTPPQGFNDYAEELDAFLRTWQKERIGSLAERYPSEQTALEVPVSDIRRFDDALADDVLAHPELFIDYFTHALRIYDLPADLSLSAATVRLVELPQSRQFTVGQFDPDAIEGELIALRGQISRQTPRQIAVHDAAYSCKRCGTQTTVPQHDVETRQEPHECQGCERQGPFQFEFESSDTEQYQALRLQTPPEEATSTQTDTIDIRVHGDQVGAVESGDRIIANVFADASWRDADSAILELHGEAHSIEPLERSIDDYDSSAFSEQIAELQEAHDTLQQIVDSIAPSHMGDERVKRAIAYLLFGGVDGELPDGSNKRGTVHVLLCGDPGCGKSALLWYVNRIAPRGVFTTGKGSTTAGLTFAAVQDDFAEGGRSLEAGALVEAHTGVCCIDELDKMESDDQDGVLECMSDQTVSRSVWGQTRTLPANTSILCAENPKHGRFDQVGEPIAAQINLDPALISRFDLIFTMTDQPDEDEDRALAEHILDTQKAGQLQAAGKPVGIDTADPVISPDVLRAYTANQRKISPVLTDAAYEAIRDEYVDLRLKGIDEDAPVPVIARDLLAMVRLAEALARIDDSERIEERHAEQVIADRRDCLQDIGIDPETGDYDADVIETGQSASQRERVKSLQQIIDDLCREDHGTRGADREAVLEAAVEHGHDRDKIEHQIEKLRDSGDLYAPSNGRLEAV